MTHRSRSFQRIDRIWFAKYLFLAVLFREQLPSDVRCDGHLSLHSFSNDVCLPSTSRKRESSSLTVKSASRVGKHGPLQTSHSNRVATACASVASKCLCRSCLKQDNTINNKSMLFRGDVVSLIGLGYIRILVELGLSPQAGRLSRCCQVQVSGWRIPNKQPFEAIAAVKALQGAVRWRFL